MGNKFQVEVKESKEELRPRWHHAVTASSRERLQMLYWLKQDAIATRKELSQKLDRDESTVYRRAIALILYKLYLTNRQFKLWRLGARHCRLNRGH